LKAPWQHTQECIRVSYAQDPALVKKGVDIIAREVKKLYDNG
jgi:valine--pyruvate aminotransferase